MRIHSKEIKVKCPTCQADVVFNLALELDKGWTLEKLKKTVHTHRKHVFCLECQTYFGAEGKIVITPSKRVKYEIRVNGIEEPYK